MPEGIDINLSPEQTQALDYLEDQETNLVLYGGQAGGGKSFLIALWQILNRLNMPGTRGYIARESGLKDIKNSILVTFFDVCQLLQIGNRIKYNDQKSYIDFDNGSRIVLLDAFYYPSDPNFDRLGSTEYTDGAIEEGITINKKAQQVLLSRTRYKHTSFNLVAKQLITCNPGDGFLKDEVVIPALEGRLDKRYKFVNATLDSNPNKAFVDTYRSTLNLMDDYDRARLLHGDWFAQPKTGGEFYKKFNEKQNVKKLRYDNSKPLHITFDFNVNPYMTCCVWQLDGTHAKQIDEICLTTPRNTTRDTCKEFAYRYKDHTAGLFVYGDPAGRHEDTRTEKGHNDYRIIEETLKDYKPSLRVKSKAPSIVERGNFINAIFEGRVDKVVVEIGDNCNKTISDYNFVKEAPDGTKAKTKITDPTTKVRYEKYGHCFVANTMVRTIYGLKPIQEIEVGDLVLTRVGYKPVVRSGLTRKNAYVNTYEIAGKKITCTTDHKIFTTNGFKAVNSLTGTNTFCIFEQCEKQYYTKALNSITILKAKILAIGDILRDTLKLTGLILKFIYTAINGLLKRGTYQTATIYTIKTATPTITTYLTLNVLACLNICAYIGTVRLTNNGRKQKTTYKNLHSQKLKSGTQAQKVKNGIANTLKRFTKKTKKLLFVRSAANQKKREALGLNFVQSDVKVDITQGYYADVYDLTIKDQHEFYADDILVHNCSDANDYFITFVFNAEFAAYQKGSRPKVYGYGGRQLKQNF